MKPRSSKVLTRASALLNPEAVCSSCQRSILRRQYASAAAAAASAEDLPMHGTSKTSSTQRRFPEVLRPTFYLLAGVVLSRPPQITRDLTSFEKAFFFYQRRLNERLALPFTKNFYFQKGTPADVDWKRKIKVRTTPSRDIGIYNPYREDGWADEALVGAKESEPEHQVEQLLKDVESTASDDGEKMQLTQRETVERPMPRISEADRKGDEKSLNRLLQRSLYLLVKNEQGKWNFPSAPLKRGESLHEAAERIILHGGGENMNTWVVGNAPIGYYRYQFPRTVVNSEKQTEDLGEKVFFMKARIMAGQANLAENNLGLTDFKWLAKEEIQKHVTEKYWSMTQDMLADR